jgi:hypothetical protein
VCKSDRLNRGRCDSSLGTESQHLWADLAKRLRGRRDEIEDRILAQVQAIAAPAGSEDHCYRIGTHVLIEAILDYCIENRDTCEEWPTPVSRAASAQARRAACGGVGIDIVVRRLFAGRAVLDRVLIEEAERAGLGEHPEAMVVLEAVMGRLFERLTAAVTLEHDRARQRLGDSREQRRLEIVREMLAGEEIDVSELQYEFADDAWHVGVIAMGINALPHVRAVAARLGLASLLLLREREVVWGWLGARRKLPMNDVEKLLRSEPSHIARFALSEPRRGICGWRESHQLARALQPLMTGRSDRVIRCRDVVLEAAVVAKPELAGVLVESYLRPLDGLRIGGATARNTLRAYLDCERSVSSAAQRLGVSRPAVEKRLAQIDAALGRRVAKYTAEIELALRLDELRQCPACDDGIMRRSSGPL